MRESLKIPSTFEAVTWFVYYVHTEDWRIGKKWNYFVSGLFVWPSKLKKKKFQKKFLPLLIEADFFFILE